MAVGRLCIPFCEFAAGILGFTRRMGKGEYAKTRRRAASNPAFAAGNFLIDSPRRLPLSSSPFLPIGGSMARHGLFFILVFSALLVVSTKIDAAEQSGGLPEGPGRDLLMSKCFQCHSEGMWKDQRQDRRGWEGTLYRMVGRGALWTEGEINAMASYLATLPAQEAKTSKTDSK
jgi:hypothetical protein